MFGSFAQRSIAADEPATVIVIGTIHGRHRTNVKYSYDVLYRWIERLGPDLVGVEIRPEDLAADQGYLRANYPKEMVDLLDTYRGRAFGIDWLGRDLEGRGIPDKWWTELSPLKRLEREMDADESFSSPVAEDLDRRRLNLLEAATPESLSDGRFDELTKQHNVALRALYQNSKYATVIAFHDERDFHLAKNVSDAVRANPGKRIIVVTGASHRGPILEWLRANLGDALRTDIGLRSSSRSAVGREPYSSVR
jgi:pheromone shutdown protein TraB